MNISNYQPSQPPLQIETVINQLFRNRLHKRITVDKSDFNLSLPLQLDQLRRQYSQISQRSTFSDQSDHEEKVLTQSTSQIESVLKHKLITKQLKKSRALQISKVLHNKYTTYMVNFLHKSNLSLIRSGIPPNLSVLETVDEGNYVLNDSATLYERKDYPHYSNVIKLHQIPIQQKQFTFLNQPQRIRTEELYFQVEDNCVLKIKQVFQFVASLFKRSVQFSKKIKSIRYSSEGHRESENHDFELIAQEIGLHFRTTKLLYDILNEFYGFERQMVKGEESKIKASKQIRESLKKLLEGYKVNEAVHIPHGQLYISLRQIRRVLHEQVLANQQNDSD